METRYTYQFTELERGLLEESFVCLQKGEPLPEWPKGLRKALSITLRRMLEVEIEPSFLERIQTLRQAMRDINA